MEWHPRANLQSRRLLQRTLHELTPTLEAGWRGDATRPKADLAILLDHLAIGFVGLYPHTTYGRRFLLHEILGGCEQMEHLQPPLGFLDPEGVVICSVLLWPSILDLAITGALTIEVEERPTGPLRPVRWQPHNDDDDDA